MTDPKEQHPNQGLLNAHSLMLEALRHREQDIFRYLVILVPALGGFFWLILKTSESCTFNSFLFIAGSIGVEILLLFGAWYCIALGYSYRSIELQLSVYEEGLRISQFVLPPWRLKAMKKKDGFKYLSFPPEVINVFWWLFFISSLGVLVATCIYLKTKSVIDSCCICLTVSMIIILFFSFWPVWSYNNKLKILTDETLTEYE